jgi:hypothetical protein
MSEKLKKESLKVEARRFARRLFYSAWLQWQRSSMERKRPCVVIFPSNQPWDAASNLRAWLLAPELRKLGWRAVVVPEALSLKQRLRILAVEKPDVILLQQTRHPLNDPRLYAPYPCVLDMDDADYLDLRIQAHISLCAKNAAAVVGGSRFVRDCLKEHNSFARVIWTTSPGPAEPPEIHPDRRQPIVAWAHATPLHYPTEAAFIQRVMVAVARRTRCIFWLFGTNEEEAKEWLSPIREAGATCETISMLSYPDYLERVAQAAVGLQPVCTENAFSRGKSFGKVLAYLAGQVAVVASNNVDHPLLFDGSNGVLLENDVDEWADEIVKLMENVQHRSEIAIAGWNIFNSRLITSVSATLFDRVFREAIASSTLNKLGHAELQS